MATLIIAFNLENIAGLLYNQREMLVTEMQKDDSWKGLGTKLEGSSPNRSGGLLHTWHIGLSR